ncbi:MAG: hypothetical protein SWH78_10070 [Thermodesulfobacteriota bacterium]|nr:hypothetical protein [Thermodesulfobacteriota bacterium]
MKTRKKLLVMAAVFGVVALCAASAHAGWNLATVTQAGPGWGTTYLRLTQASHPGNQNGLFTDKWFKPRTDSVKEMLATALTAKTNNEHVWFFSDFSGTYPYIKALYMGPPPE